MSFGYYAYMFICSWVLFITQFMWVFWKSQGVQCKRVARSINSVGLYVPGGTAVLPSTALMLAVVRWIIFSTSYVFQYCIILILCIWFLSCPI